MERATKAVDTYDYAKLEESLELSNAEMLIDCRGGGDLQTDLYDYIVKRCEENSDKIAQTSNGKYWIDADGRLCYTDNDTNRSVKLRKDANGNPKIMDPNVPITTYRVQYDANGGTGVPTDTSEYEEGETVNVNFGTTPTREKYVFLGWARNASATVPEYTSGANFTMGTENVTLYAVWTCVSGRGTSVMKSAWYGDTVSYSANGVEDWKCFYNDGTYLYLITSDYLPVGKVPTNRTGLTTAGTYQAYWNAIPSFQNDWNVNKNSFLATEYNLDNYAGNANSKCISTLLNCENWSDFASGVGGDVAIGSPTVEMFVKSWNAKGYTTLYTNTNATGYYVGTSANPTTIDTDLSSTDGYSDTLFYPHTSPIEETWSYRLASTCSYGNTAIKLVECRRFN